MVTSGIYPKMDPTVKAINLSQAKHENIRIEPKNIIDRFKP
jgi:hypothetical protein